MCSARAKPTPRIFNGTSGRGLTAFSGTTCCKRDGRPVWAAHFVCASYCRPNGRAPLEGGKRGSNPPAARPTARIGGQRSPWIPKPIWRKISPKRPVRRIEENFMSTTEATLRAAAAALYMAPAAARKCKTPRALRSAARSRFCPPTVCPSNVRAEISARSPQIDPSQRRVDLCLRRRPEINILRLRRSDHVGERRGDHLWN